jgi:hypothetical protein
MSELPSRARGAKPGVRAHSTGASQWLASDPIVGHCRPLGMTIGSVPSGLTLRATGARSCHPGDDSRSAPHCGVRTGGRITDQQRAGACARRSELHLGAVRP